MEFSFPDLVKAYGEAWTYFGHLDLVIFMLMGMSISIVLGIIPVIGPSIATSAFLGVAPFLSPLAVVGFLVGAEGPGLCGGAITTVLLGIPGGASNTPTLLDGYSLTKKGEPGRALGLVLAATAFGALYSMAFALFMIPLVLPLVTGIASPEMIFIVLMGLTMIATLSRGSMIKGLISGVLGIVVSLVGIHAVTGLERFTFGTLYLRDGIPLVPVVIGIFGISEILELAAVGGTISQTGTCPACSVKSMLVGVKEFLRTQKRLNLISSIIGYIIGILPGVGQGVAAWVSYGQAKQTSRHPELFGTGVPEGVVAPESANNACTAGDLLTTMALGIPGSGSMVIVLAGLTIVGLQPGPVMVGQNLPLVLNSMIIVGLGGIISALTCLFAAKYLVKVTTVSGDLLVPILMAIILAGVYIGQERFLDLTTMVIFGLVGAGLKVLGFNRPAFVLGFILGGMFELYLFLSLQSEGPMFFLRPISLALIAVTALLIAYQPISGWLRARRRPAVRGG